MEIREILESGYSYSRVELSLQTGLSDRHVRDRIRKLRREGVPILPLKDGGYKLAETDEEKQQLLNLYRCRAMDELKTYSALKKSFHNSGQTVIEEMEKVICGI